jgi:hypothetical protein
VEYIKDVKAGKLPPNNKIIFLLQVLSSLTLGDSKSAAQFEFRITNKGLLFKE